MNPQLYIFKKHELERSNSKKRIYFVVVNTDKAKEYPANFVCVLPTQKNSIENPVTTFSRAFGKDSLALAKKLLKGAFDDEDDPEIRAEIEKRLRLIGSRWDSRRRVSSQGRYFVPQAQVANRFMGTDTDSVGDHSNPVSQQGHQRAWCESQA